MKTERVTKASLIRQIGAKTQKVKPFIREPFMKGLKSKSKAELERLSKLRVDRDGYGMRFD